MRDGAIPQLRHSARTDGPADSRSSRRRPRPCRRARPPRSTCCTRSSAPSIDSARIAAPREFDRVPGAAGGADAADDGEREVLRRDAAAAARRRPARASTSASSAAGTAWRARARPPTCRCRTPGSRTRHACWCANRRTRRSCRAASRPAPARSRGRCPGACRETGSRPWRRCARMLASSVSTCVREMGSRMPCSSPCRRVVVGRGDDRADAPRLAAGKPQAFVGLRARHLVDQVAIDVEERRCRPLRRGRRGYPIACRRACART